MIPSIWKNRPRGVPEAGLYVQHRDIKGNLTQSWEQPISSEAKNSAELLTVAIEKPLSEGSLEVYLQNGSKNEVYYWGLQTVKNVEVNTQIVTKLLPPKPPKDPSPSGGCGEGNHRNEAGECKPDIPQVGDTDVFDGGIWECIGVDPNSGGSMWKKIGDSPSQNTGGDSFWINNDRSGGSDYRGSYGNGNYYTPTVDPPIGWGNGSGNNGGDPEKSRCITCKKAVREARDIERIATASDFVTDLGVCVVEGVGFGIGVAAVLAWMEVIPGFGTAAHLTAIAFAGRTFVIGCAINKTIQAASRLATAEAAYYTGLQDCGNACPNP